MKRIKVWLKNLEKDERGLTLVELLAVIVILAIVGLIAFVAIGNVIENSKKDAHISNAIQAINAAELYESSGGKITDGSIGGGTSAKNLDELGKLVNPWDNNDDDYDFILKKNGEGEITASSSATYGGNAECKFDDKTKVDLSGDRDLICP